MIHSQASGGTGGYVQLVPGVWGLNKSLHLHIPSDKAPSALRTLPRTRQPAAAPLSVSGLSHPLLSHFSHTEVL